MLLMDSNSSAESSHIVLRGLNSCEAACSEIRGIIRCWTIFLLGVNHLLRLHLHFLLRSRASSMFGYNYDLLENRSNLSSAACSSVSPTYVTWLYDHNPSLPHCRSSFPFYGILYANRYLTPTIWAELKPFGFMGTIDFKGRIIQLGSWQRRRRRRRFERRPPML